MPEPFSDNLGARADAAADDFPIVITALPGRGKTAFRGFAIMMILVVMVTPFANIHLARVDGFTPVIQTMMCIADLLTATFLFAHYSVKPQCAVLVLASGFVFSGLFAFLQTLAFPDAYVPGVLIGDNLNSSAWLFVCWHTMFPLAVIVYALSKDESEAASPSGRSTAVAIAIVIACVVAVTAGLTWGATAGVGYLPSVYKNATEQVPIVARILNAYLALLIATAIVLLFLRRRTILDQWLIVTLFAWLPNFVVAILFTVVRFTAGWYISRVYALLAGCSLLAVLLAETLILYTRLAKAVALLRRSEGHQRLLIAELDHRVKNVLAQVDGIIASTGQRSQSTNDFIRSLRGRVRSMGAAHGLLSQTRWRGVGLDRLVRTELAPYVTGTNFKISGTDIILTAVQTQALAKVLHELATNAAKYGSLSISGGRVSVAWDRKPNGQEATLLLEWREQGGPPVAAEIKSSYGTGLIRELIPHELGGKVDLAFASDGACCRIEFPLERDA